MSNQWKLKRERQKGVERWIIRRWNGARAERLPREQYKNFENDKQALDAFVVRLNFKYEEHVKSITEIKHAFISTEFLDKYRDEHLRVQLSEREAKYEFHCVKKHFINFFIVKLKLVDPAQWYAVHKEAWASYLLTEAPPSKQSKRRIIQAANRFMRYLNTQRPNEVPLPYKFEPLSRSKFKTIAAERALAGLSRGKLISIEDWKKIEAALGHAAIEPFVRLASCYGLRRAETLGLEPTDIRQGYLLVERQAKKGKQIGPLKGRKPRRVPHWYSTPKDTFKWIKAAQGASCHPDTLSKRWAKLMTDLNLSYDFHDLRHTWITRAMRDYLPRDVQLSAGHENINTTMGYLHDDRDSLYMPEVA